MSQTVKTAISGTHFKRFFRLLFLLLLFSFGFFEKVMSNWRENFLHITQQQRKKRITTD